jgi:hypothetical protein
VETTILNIVLMHIRLEIIDTAGNEQFSAMRELYIKSGHGFILVYSIISESSLAELPPLYDQILKAKEEQALDEKESLSSRNMSPPASPSKPSKDENGRNSSSSTGSRVSQLITTGDSIERDSITTMII